MYIERHSNSSCILFFSLQSQILTIEMTRGWNSRLGFSLQSGANGTDTEIVAIYADSLAARDGRLKVGDVILEVSHFKFLNFSIF